MRTFIGRIKSPIRRHDHYLVIYMCSKQNLRAVRCAEDKEPAVKVQLHQIAPVSRHSHRAHKRGIGGRQKSA
jgi:hypothetical protein